MSEPKRSEAGQVKGDTTAVLCCSEGGDCHESVHNKGSRRLSKSGGDSRLPPLLFLDLRSFFRPSKIKERRL